MFSAVEAASCELPTSNKTLIFMSVCNSRHIHKFIICYYLWLTIAVYNPIIAWFLVNPSIPKNHTTNSEFNSFIKTGGFMHHKIRNILYLKGK